LLPTFCLTDCTAAGTSAVPALWHCSRRLHLLGYTASLLAGRCCYCCHWCSSCCGSACTDSSLAVRLQTFAYESICRPFLFQSLALLCQEVECDVGTLKQHQLQAAATETADNTWW
jgi:hypothetical protein